MNKFFNLDNAFFRFMDKVTDFLFINFLTLLCSLPIFTIGAALTAAHKMMQNIVFGDEQPIFKPYFRVFAHNFKQATIFWLSSLFVLALIVADILLVYWFMKGFAVLVAYGLLLIVALFLFGLASYMFPLLARYENTLKQHIRNAMILSIGNLPRTIVIMVVNAAPLLLALVNLEIFFKSSILWFFFGISLLIYLDARLVCPVFKKYDQMTDNDENVALETS